mmetsp:Transcript_33662/g.77675  ORF Transcript_33662/g.77675 Transcript_33662/m.77675 type:complete len:893 (-) Transcript_33662:119-2797(-)
METAFVDRVQPEMGVNGYVQQPGTAASGYVQTGIAASGYVQPGTAAAGPGIAADGCVQPGIIVGGYVQPGIIANGYVQPGIVIGHHAEPNIAVGNHVMPEMDVDHNAKPEVTDNSGDYVDPNDIFQPTTQSEKKGRKWKKKQQEQKAADNAQRNDEMKNKKRKKKRGASAPAEGNDLSKKNRSTNHGPNLSPLQQSISAPVYSTSAPQRMVMHRPSVPAPISSAPKTQSPQPVVSVPTARRMDIPQASAPVPIFTAPTERTEIHQSSTTTPAIIQSSMRPMASVPPGARTDMFQSSAPVPISTSPAEKPDMHQLSASASNTSLSKNTSTNNLHSSTPALISPVPTHKIDMPQSSTTISMSSAPANMNQPLASVLMPSAPAVNNMDVHKSSTPMPTNFDPTDPRNNMSQLSSPVPASSVPIDRSIGNSSTPNASTKKSVPSFRSKLASLPLASFSLPYEGKPEGEGISENSKKEAPKPPKVVYKPFEALTEEGKIWAPLVNRTRSSPAFKGCFYQPVGKKSPEGTVCVRPRAYGQWCEGNPHVIAIDCEMCECRRGRTILPDALCRISVVNGLAPEEILIDTLVKPEWEISDYRTFVNGIERKHLEKVKFTLDHAREFMLSLMSDQTVVVGHAVDNDLKALRIFHEVCVDSSMLYSVKGTQNGGTPNLMDLSVALCDKNMPDIHDSVNDARTALLAIQTSVGKDLDNLDWEIPRAPGHKERRAEKLKNQRMSRSLSRTPPRRVNALLNGPPDRDRNRSQSLNPSRHQGQSNSYHDRGNMYGGGNDQVHGNKYTPTKSTPEQGFLFVHRIPKICKPEHLKILFERHAGGAQLAEVPTVVFKGNYGKTVVTFETKEEADKAFAAIASKAQVDTSGEKKQKRVYLQQGGYLNVREM